MGVGVSIVLCALEFRQEFRLSFGKLFAAFS